MRITILGLLVSAIIASVIITAKGASIVAPNSATTASITTAPSTPTTPLATESSTSTATPTTLGTIPTPGKVPPLNSPKESAGVKAPEKSPATSTAVTPTSDKNGSSEKPQIQAPATKTETPPAAEKAPLAPSDTSFKTGGHDASPSSTVKPANEDKKAGAAEQAPLAAGPPATTIKSHSSCCSGAKTEAPSEAEPSSDISSEGKIIIFRGICGPDGCKVKGDVYDEPPSLF